MVTKPSIPSKVEAFQPAEWEVFGSPPLIPGEDPAAYWGLLERIAAAVHPKDFLERMWVRDMVDLEWDVLRGRRMKAQIVKVAQAEHITKLLTNSVGEKAANGVAATWDAPEIREALTPDMARAGITSDSIMAHAYVSKLDEIERVEDMTASAEARRNNAFREIDRHRQAFGTALRREVDAVDAEYTEVPTEDDEAARLQ